MLWASMDKTEWEHCRECGQPYITAAALQKNRAKRITEGATLWQIAIVGLCDGCKGQYPQTLSASSTTYEAVLEKITKG